MPAGYLGKDEKNLLLFVWPVRGGKSAPVAPINGVCGSANNSTFTIAPAINLCTTGTASSVTGTGPWSWSCLGSNGGSTAGCSAKIVDTIKPMVTTFTLSQQIGLTVQVALAATDNVAVTGHLITASATLPTSSAPWQTIRPTSYTFAAGTTGGVKTLYAWARDAAGNISVAKSATVTLDTAIPTVTAFTVPALSSSMNVAITTFTATDAIGVTGKLITEDPAKPLASAAGWLAAPTSYTFATPGAKTLYAWAKDAAGNVSTARIARITVDATLPTIDVFTVPAIANKLAVAITSFTATDNAAVTGKMINENPTQPLASAIGWKVAPTSYTFATPGTKTLYAWAKDAAGNVSAAKSATITIDTTIPTVDVFTVPAVSSTMTVAITSFTASDNIGITGTIISEVSTRPLATTAGWAAAPSSYTFATPGVKTLYAWARDVAGNVSLAKIAKVTVKLP